VAGHRSPATADVENPVPRFRIDRIESEIELARDRVGERLVVAREESM
jgi:hypothetical protein